MLSPFNTDNVDNSWQPILEQAYQQLDKDYIEQLTSNRAWLPGADKIFNAFSQPLEQTQYILFGESPYPRTESANGYAFWDANVSELWSDKGLAKTVNRATSLRNIIKMLLVADGALDISDTSQTAIQQADKSSYINTLDDLFNSMINKGFLLLNASLVLRKNGKVTEDGKLWLPFMESLLDALSAKNIQLILFGKIAEKINLLTCAQNFDQLVAEHPYNLSFISNHDVLSFFKPLNLLKK